MCYWAKLNFKKHEKKICVSDCDFYNTFIGEPRVHTTVALASCTILVVVTFK